MQCHGHGNMLHVQHVHVAWSHAEEWNVHYDQCHVIAFRPISVAARRYHTTKYNELNSVFISYMFSNYSL